MVRPVSNNEGFFPLPTLYLAPWAVALLAVTAALCLPAKFLSGLAIGLLAASVLLVGLPHGAADWWVMRRAADGRWTPAAQVKAASLYVLAALLALGGWFWQPGISLAAFLALTAWHFGSAEASVLMPERRTFRDVVWWMFAVGRGLLVVFTPLAFRPVEAARVLWPFTSLGPEVTVVLDSLLRAALPLTWLGVIAQTAAVRFDVRSFPGPEGRRRLTCNILETCVLLMLFRLVPPLLAFVAYWTAFHCWRHILRLESWLLPSGQGQSWWRMLVDFHRRTLALTLLSLPGFVLIFWLWPRLFKDASNATAAYLILLSVLTVPHAMVIGWLDEQKAEDGK